MKICIITPTLNCLEDLKKQINNIDQYANKNLVHIIIDGGSIDGTFCYADKLKNENRLVIQRKGEGIYEAMNTGAIHAPAGSFLLFLGVDDYIEGEIPRLKEIPKNKAYFFNVTQNNIIKNKKKIYYCNLPKKITEKNYLSFPVHHQGLLVKKEWYCDNPIKKNLGIHADYEQMIRLINSEACEYIDCTFVTYSTGGASDYFSINNWKSLKMIALELKISWMRSIIFQYKNSAKMLIKILVGKSLIELVRMKIK